MNETKEKQSNRSEKIQSKPDLFQVSFSEDILLEKSRGTRDFEQRKMEEKYEHAGIIHVYTLLGFRV